MRRSLRRTAGVFPWRLGRAVKDHCVLAVADYVTGLIKAVYLKQLSSEVGYKGLLKKILMFIIIAVAFEIQKFLNHAVALREIVITFYVCNEAISLLENAAEFIPIPEKLKEVLIQLRDKEEQ